MIDRITHYILGHNWSPYSNKENIGVKVGERERREILSFPLLFSSVGSLLGQCSLVGMENIK